MSSLYKDAIADARKLREAAEQNAKNRIIEAVTPKLRRLIERQILEGDEFVDDSAIDDLLDTEDAVDMMDDEIDSVPEAEPMSLGMDSIDMDSDGLGSIEVIPDYEGMDSSSLEDFEEEDEEDSESEDGDTNKSVHVNITVESKRNRLLQHRAVRLVKALSEAKSRTQRIKIRKELAVLRQALIITENSQNLRLAKNIKVILKESTMRRRNTNWLFEGKDGEPGEEVEFDDAGFEEGDVDVDAIKDAVADLASAVGMDVSADDADDLDDDDLDDDDLDDDDFDDLDDDDLEEAYEGLEENDEMGDEDDEGMMEADELDQCENDEIVEVNEAMLRRALGASRRRRTPRRVNESRRARIARARRRRRLAEGEAKAMASSFGGGKLGKEMFVDVDENTLLNALAEELGGSVANSTSAKGKASAKASHFGGGSIKASKALKESKRRTIRAQRQAKAAKAELKESNLFNAKLLYVTKLMQSHTLNNKQQRAIIEAMDNAKTQREAKLLFSSLNESLNKRTSQKKAAQSNKLTENRSRTGTTSGSLRSGQASRGNGVELDRWAVLAGLKK